MRRRFNRLTFLLVSALLVFGVFVPLFLQAGVKSAHQRVGQTSKTAFIKGFAPIAQKIGKEYEIKPSLLIAQASLESDFGRNLLGGKYHNLYALPSLDGRSAITLKRKTPQGSWQEQAYQVYARPEASLRDYVNRLRDQTVGNPYLYQDLLAAKTVKEAINALAVGQYTDDPDYADRLLKLVEDHDLTKYDPKN